MRSSIVRRIMPNAMEIEGLSLRDLRRSHRQALYFLGLKRELRDALITAGACHSQKWR